MWQLLGENDAVQTGLQFKLDFSIGKRWAWLIQDKDSDGACAGLAVHATAGALAVLCNPLSKNIKHEEGHKEDRQTQPKPEETTNDALCHVLITPQGA